jgi:prepilin-type N-terminal cleavage/methylation domain-containing protein
LRSWWTPGAETRARLADRRGFTLIEAVVALLIVALALVPMLASARQALVGEARVGPARETVALAEARMEELALIPADSIAAYLSPREGRFPAPYAAYRWRALMRGEPQSPALFRAAVIVDGPGGTYSLETTFHRPEMLPQFAGR